MTQRVEGTRVAELKSGFYQANRLYRELLDLCGQHDDTCRLAAGQAEDWLRSQTKGHPVGCPCRPGKALICAEDMLSELSHEPDPPVAKCPTCGREVGAT